MTPDDRVPTPEVLVLLAQLAEKQAADRLQRILSADRPHRLDGIAEDVGLTLLSQELAIMPPPGTDLRQLVLAKYDLEPRFAAALKAWVMLVERYLDAERERCRRAVEDIDTSGDHCCVEDEGQVVKRNPCTCWRAELHRALAKILEVRR